MHADFWQTDCHNGQYRNPILYADYSDPDLVRVGDDFYMVASSFNHLPGLPLLHSRDLVNWRLVNHIVPRLTMGDYDRVQPGKGIWAPSIRYHDGRFWVFFSTPDEGIFMCQAVDPLGDWSEPHCLRAAKGHIDPCPFWDDDGRAWLVHAFAFSRSGKKHQLALCEMSPDGRKLLDDGEILYDGQLDLPTLEGPKVYKRNGYYYVFAPAGGVPTGWQTVLRSRSLHGPWEHRVALHQGVSAVNGPHQGGWVELENGEGWFVHFQDAHIAGRIVHLQPVVWRDDWPVIGAPGPSGIGEPVSQWTKPAVNGAPLAAALPASDAFHEGKPGPQWQWLANPQAGWFSSEAGHLRLHCQTLPEHEGQPSFYHAPNLLLQKFPGPRFEAHTRLRPQLRLPGECAGLTVYGERFAWFGAEQTSQGLALVFGGGWMNDSGSIVSRKTSLVVLPSDTTLSLKVVVDGDGLCTFCWRLADEPWQTVEPRFAAAPGKWVGAKMGLFAVALGEAAGRVEVEAFEVTVHTPDT
ncbi:Beta-xylosidase [Cronobacter condimenti 1330]|nr:Beta-xylosidase [Cronobacter condimenti 1330]